VVQEAHVTLGGELDQVQGIILNGYTERFLARYVVFEITVPELARKWLAEILPEVQFGEFRRTPRDAPPFLRDLCVNVAFTYAGFEKIGLHPTALAGFSLPFQEGLSEPNRARRLGDDGQSDPLGWRWGKPGDPVHGVVAVFGGKGPAGYPSLDAADATHDESEIEQWLALHFDEGRHGVRAVATLPATPTNGKLRKEHFGFRDGIANPRLQGLAKPGAFDVIADGEMLLGYENGYSRFPLSPEVPQGADPRRRLPAATDRPNRADFGKNGSYLVFRQLEQDVQAFWRYVFEAKDDIPGLPSGLLGAEWLGSRLVGRWPNGTPVTRFPHRQGPTRDDVENHFLYAETGDAYGERCPIGSHVRRTNPRDTGLPVPHDPELSGTPYDEKVRAERVRLTNLHRLMRRGRSYGPPIDPRFDPEKLRESHDTTERGLYFLCVCGDLNRQFEFVQSNWALSPTFAGLSKDPDPLIAAKRQSPFPAATFTIQGCPTRRVHDLPRVVEARGGAYFFLPSRAALEYLSSTT
jgi:Dyp-type peroxidase family